MTAILPLIILLTVPYLDADDLSGIKALLLAARTLVASSRKMAEIREVRDCKRYILSVARSHCYAETLQSCSAVCSKTGGLCSSSLPS